MHGCVWSVNGCIGYMLQQCSFAGFMLKLDTFHGFMLYWYHGKNWCDTVSYGPAPQLSFNNCFAPLVFSSLLILKQCKCADHIDGCIILGNQSMV